MQEPVVVNLLQIPDHDLLATVYVHLGAAMWSLQKEGQADPRRRPAIAATQRKVARALDVVSTAMAAVRDVDEAIAALDPPVEENDSLDDIDYIQ